MNNTEIANIYYRMKPEDHRLFHQFKSFHKLFFNVHGHDALSHHLARGNISDIFSNLPARDADTIANAWADLLAAERLKDLCKQLGLAIPVELQTYKPPEVPPPPLQFPSHQDKEKQVAQEQPQPPLAEADIKLDIKPPRRLATSFLGKPGLLRMLGSGDEDHIITKVLPGMDSLQEYDEDDPTQIITIDYKTDDSSDVDDIHIYDIHRRHQQGGIPRIAR